MTSLDKIERAGEMAAPQNQLVTELMETIRLSAPMALTQLGQIAMMTTDLAFIGRLGDEAVAAAALGHTRFFIRFTFRLGLVAAVAPPSPPGFCAPGPSPVRPALRPPL